MGGKLVAHVACEKCPISAAQPRHAFESSRVGRVNLTGIRSVKKPRRNDGHIHRWYLCAMILLRRSLAVMLVPPLLLPTPPRAPPQVHPNRPLRRWLCFAPAATTDVL